MDPKQCATHYESLNVREDSTTEAIKAAYKQAVLRLHPDKLGPGHQEQPTTTQQFLAVQEAFKVLQDPVSRSAYDKQLELQRAANFVAVSAVMDLSDLEPTWDGGKYVYCHACRCSGHYSFSEVDLSEQQDHIVVQCDTCSLHIKVTYTVSED